MIFNLFGGKQYLLSVIRIVVSVRNLMLERMTMDIPLDMIV